MASNDRIPLLPQSGETVPGEATLAPVARLTPSPSPRADGDDLPKRDPRRGRHWISSDPRQRRGQRTVAELKAQIDAEYHITDVQARLDAAERAS